MPPTRDRGEDAGPPSHVDPRVWFVRPARAVHQVLALHVDAVEGIRGGTEHDRLDIVIAHPRGVQSHPARLEGEFSPRLQHPSSEECHPRPDNRDPSLRLFHLDRIATAPVAVGFPRQESARALSTPFTWLPPASLRIWRTHSRILWSPVASIR